MQNEVLNGEKINEILNKTLEAINEGKKEIFDIAESLREECEILKEQISELQVNVSEVINKVDKLELEEKRCRTRLLIVSKNFNKYSEDDIKKAYESANDFRIKLMLMRQREKELIDRRKELEIRLKNNMETLSKAENLVSQVGVAFDYLAGDLDNILETVEDMNKKQHLGIRIIEAQEEERQRVARDIHDGPAQTMANLVLKAELCYKLLAIDNNRVKVELQDLKSIVRSSLKDIRKIIYDLRPMSLDDLGLIPTVQRYSENFSDDTGIIVRVNLLKDENKLDSIIELAIFRIIQEALNNVRKHSKATNVDINIEIGVKYFNLIIKDNGVGFNQEKVLNNSKDKENGFGIIGMKERAELLNGKLQIKSSLDRGTKIILVIPINGKDEVYGG